MQFRHAAIGAIMASAAFVSACTPWFDYAPKGTRPNSSATGTGHNIDTSSQACPAKDLQYLVGQPRTVLQTMRFGSEVRFEEPGQIITKEFIASRTRIIIGADGKIARILCG